MLSIVLLTFLGSQLLISPVVADCEIDPLITQAPLLVTEGNKIIYPQYGAKTVRFQAGETLYFACPGGVVQVEGSPIIDVVNASCVTGARFLVNGQRFLWWQVTCNKNPVVVSRYTAETCTGGKIAEIGYDLSNGRFIRTLSVCYDSVNQTALYVEYQIISSIGAQSTGTPRPEFKQDPGFYNVGSTNVNSLYVRTGQRKTINNLLGLSDTDTKYIKADNFYFLSRGHMAARADFFYPFEQNATFRYINAAPHWQTVNGYNWNQVEMDSRNYASSNNATLQIWTGVYGISTLPHATTNRETNLFLYVNNNSRGIPVPALYWKVMYNPITKKGVALLSINNPYKTVTNKDIICPDVSSSLKWLKWNRTSILHGYSYACSIGDLRQVIHYAPNLSVSGLLV